MSKLVNAVPIETHRGYRTITLVRGDLTQVESGIVVLSSHAGSGLAGGQTVTAWRRRHGVAVEKLEPLVLMQGTLKQAGTFEVVDDEIGPEGIRLLVVRLPGPQFIRSIGKEAEDVFREAVWTLFGSLAALELRSTLAEHSTVSQTHAKSSFLNVGRVSVPLLGGNRSYPLSTSVETLLAIAMRWLRMSTSSEGIQLIAYDDASAGAWSAAINKVLNRRAIGVGEENSVTEKLREEALAELVGVTGMSAETKESVESLREILGSSTIVGMSVQQTATFARIFVEHLVKELASAVGADWRGSLLADIEAVTKTGRVAPWIGSHFHTLRVLGNEAVHANRTDQDQLPRGLGASDMRALLSAILAILSFWKEWTRRG